MANFVKAVFCAVTLMFCATVSAQEFYNVTGVEHSKEKNAFFILAEGNHMVQCNPLVYKLVRKNMKDYVVAYMEGQGENFLTVARKEDIKRIVFEVDSVGLNETEDAKVFFTNGMFYESSDEALLGLRKGQKLELTSILGMTQNLLRHRTVSRETPAGEVKLVAEKEPKQPEVKTDQDLTAVETTAAPETTE